MSSSSSSDAYALNAGVAAAVVALLGAFAALTAHIALSSEGDPRRRRDRVAKATVAAGLGLAVVAAAPFALRRVHLADWV